MHDGVRWIVGCDGVPAFAGSGLAPPPASAPAGSAVFAGRLVVRAVLVGGAGVGFAVLGLVALVVVSVGVGVRLTAPAAATTTAAPAASAVGGPVGLVVVAVLGIGLRVLGFVVLVFVFVVTHGGPRRDGLRCDEKGQVVGRVIGLVARPAVLGRGLQQQSRFGLCIRREILDDHYHFGVGRNRYRQCRGLCRLGILRFLCQHVTDTYGVGAVHAGMCAAGTTVQLAERVEHPPAGGPQHPRERVYSQPVGQVLAGPGGLIEIGDCAGRDVSARFGEVVGLVLDWGIVGHVVSFSPRARHETRPREGFRYEPGWLTGLVMVSPRAALRKVPRTTPGAWVE